MVDVDNMGRKREKQRKHYKKNSKRMGMNECGRPKCPKPPLHVLAMFYNSKPTCSHMISL